MHTKWKKFFIGLILIIAFISYTQFQKNAEPVWKVDEKSFKVVHSFKEGMKGEYEQLEELKPAYQHGLLKDEQIVIPIESEYRTLRIEKTWNMQSRLFLLYSVDLKERDKSINDVPYIQVKTMNLKTEKGKELTATAESFPGMNNPNSGFVYKHRLYRSLYIYPRDNNLSTDEDYEIITESNRIELQDIDILTNQEIKPFKNIALKVSNENIYEKVFDSTKINKPLTFGDNQSSLIKSYDLMFYGGRLNLDIPNIGKLVGFSGYVKEKSYPEFWQVVGNEGKGFFIPVPDYAKDFMLDKDDPIKLTFNSALLKGTKRLTWTVFKKDLIQNNKEKDSNLVKNQVIGSDHDTTITYEGLTWNNGVPAIHISVLNTNKNMEPHFSSLMPDYYYDPADINSSLFNRNLVGITNGKNEKLQNFEIYSENFQSKTNYFINFLDRTGDETSPKLSLPEENLTITVSDLLYAEPLTSPVKITLKNTH